jgi:6,7-dimethyl-8-ribityllumazine synthase
MAGHFLIVEARFYGEIADAQASGAIACARGRRGKL